MFNYAYFESIGSGSTYSSKDPALKCRLSQRLLTNTEQKVNKSQSIKTNKITYLIDFEESELDLYIV